MVCQACCFLVFRRKQKKSGGRERRAFVAARACRNRTRVLLLAVRARARAVRRARSRHRARLRSATPDGRRGEAGGATPIFAPLSSTLARPRGARWRKARPSERTMLPLLLPLLLPSRRPLARPACRAARVGAGAPKEKGSFCLFLSAFVGDLVDEWGCERWGRGMCVVWMVGGERARCGDSPLERIDGCRCRRQTPTPTPRPTPTRLLECPALTLKLQPPRYS